MTDTRNAIDPADLDFTQPEFSGRYATEYEVETDSDGNPIGLYAVQKAVRKGDRTEVWQRLTRGHGIDSIAMLRARIHTLGDEAWTPWSPCDYLTRSRRGD